MSSSRLRILRAATIASSIVAASFCGAVLIGAATILTGCGDSAPDAPDAAQPRDAGFADVIVIASDGAAGDASGPMDAASDTDAGGSSCAMGSCDPREVSECGVTAACVLSDRLPECADAVGGLEEGEPCASALECAAGLACFREGATGVCARVCCPGDEGACGDGMRCSADGVLVTGVATSWGRCGAPRACDPRAPACPTREGCYIDYRTADCRLAGTADLGQSCEVPQDCLPGFHCAGIGAPTCVRICVLSDPRSCPSAEGTCVAQAYSPEGTGVCVSTARAW